MEKRNKEMEMYLKAKKRVDRIKGFYKHLNIYIIVNIILIVIKMYIYGEIGGNGFGDQGFQDWFRLNIYFTPLAWGFGLLVHGLLVFKYPNASLKDFKPKFIKSWEEKQIQKFIDKENELE